MSKNHDYQKIGWKKFRPLIWPLIDPKLIKLKKKVYNSFRNFVFYFLDNMILWHFYAIFEVGLKGVPFFCKRKSITGQLGIKSGVKMYFYIPYFWINMIFSKFLCNFWSEVGLKVLPFFCKIINFGSIRGENGVKSGVKICFHPIFGSIWFFDIFM